MNQIIAEKLALIAENEQKVYAKGKTDGTAEGYQRGYTEGYTAGYAEGEASGGDATQFDRYFSGEDVELTVNSDRVKEYAFMDALNLKAIILPNATEIGELAFSGCSNLESVEMPNVEYIGNGAFFLAFSEISLKIPSSVKVIDETAFSDCGITEVTFEGTPESIASNTFDDCPNLDTINVPWSFEEVAGAPWGASYLAIINYDYKAGG